MNGEIYPEGKSVPSEANYMNLCVAIIYQAVLDYETVLVKEAMAHSKYEKKEAEYCKKKLEDFFYSDYYKLLTDVDPDVVLNRAKKETEQRIKWRKSLGF